MLLIFETFKQTHEHEKENENSIRCRPAGRADLSALDSANPFNQCDAPVANRDKHLQDWSRDADDADIAIRHKRYIRIQHIFIPIRASSTQTTGKKFKPDIQHNDDTDYDHYYGDSARWDRRLWKI